ncbi:hypothetical protein V6N12_073983 [Hibiscus sabdariffa]|uniref:Uncharacterized protein n=1 Tax=Hibiscus sabdariffa TaxID=183260 RepID=A0ABR1ZZ19_9ROSI
MVDMVDMGRRAVDQNRMVHATSLLSGTVERVVIRWLIDMAKMASRTDLIVCRFLDPPSFCWDILMEDVVS